jgi:succinoglycan biosynthesis transport protein ExoP
MIESRAPTYGGPTRNGVRELFRVVGRQKSVILAPTILIAGVAWTIASTTAPRFASEASLAIDVRRVEVVEHEVVSRFPQESPALALRTELDVISSRSLAEQVVNRLGLAADPDVLREAGAVHSLWQDVAGILRRALDRLFPGIAGGGLASKSDVVPNLTRSQLTDWLIGNLKVSNDGRSFTILVAFTSESPERAARIANAVAENYLDDQVRTKALATVRASDWLGEKLLKMRKELEASEAAVEEFRRATGLIETKGATVADQRLSDLNSDLVNARSERVRAETKLQAAQEGDPESIAGVLASPTVQQLRWGLTQINSQIVDNRAAVFYKEYKEHLLDAQAATLRKQLDREIKLILTRLSGEVLETRKREAALARSVQQMEKQLGDDYQARIRLSQLQREADASRSIYQTFLTRYKQTIEQQGLAAPDARLISRAEAPGVPNYPKKLQFLLLGTFGGLAIGVALAFIREGLDQRVRQASEVEAVSGIPVFGLMPRVSRWRGLEPQDYPVKEPRSAFCAALVRIHTALQVPGSSVRNQVIMVTSAKPGEGKTSFCTSLARSLAKSRTRVLVIDADPYRSRVASAFGASIIPSFGPLVEQRLRLCDIVQPDPKSTAHFIIAPSEDDLQLLLLSGGFATLIEEARRAYDVVILDTAPVMTNALAAVLGRFADTSLFLVRWGRTSWDEMMAAVGFLRLCSIGLHGIVMVGVDAGSTYYGQIGSYGSRPSDDRFLRPTSDRRLTEAE